MTSLNLKKIIICLILIKSIPLILSQCDSDEHYCEFTDKCIDSEYLCDNDNDCGDNSDEDEALCSPSTMTTHWMHREDGSGECGEYEVPCSEPLGKKCIHRNWVCDGEWDCLHGTDERNCLGQPSTASRPIIISPTRHPFLTARTQIIRIHPSISLERCTNNQFRCTDTCINLSWVCDGEEDCQDGTDETPQLCLARAGLTTQSTSTVETVDVLFEQTSSFAPIDTTIVKSNTAATSSDERLSEDCDTQSESSISFNLLNWIVCGLVVLTLLCAITAITVFICRKRKSRTVGLNSRSAEARRQQAVSFLNSSVAPECQLVLVGTPVQVQPTVVQSTPSTMDHPPPYDTQPSSSNSTKVEDCFM